MAFTKEELQKFSEENKDILTHIVNNVRIEERYAANKVLGDFGIPANQRPKIYTAAGEYVASIVFGGSGENQGDAVQRE